MPQADGPRDARPLTRRDILRGTGLGLGAAAALGALAPVARASGPILLPGETEGSPRTSAPAPSSLEDFIRSNMRQAHVPSLVGAITEGTDLHWAKGYGKADIAGDLDAGPDTVYMLASISKTIICAAAMMLWEDGSLDLDADVNDYLPFPVRNPAFPSRKITTRMLMTHTSSIRDRYSLWGTFSNPTPPGYCVGDSTISLYDVLQGYLEPGGAYYFADENFYDLRPGTKYHYSNIGSDLAALVVEEISGTDYNEFCKANVFTPLGMTQAGYRLADISTPNLAVPYRYDLGAKEYEAFPQFGYADYPSGALRTSASHLSRWLRCFMNGGELEGTRILKRSTVKEIMRPQIPGIWWQGLIWYYRNYGGNTLIGHSGSDYGVATSMFAEVNGNRGVITLANRYVTGWKAWYGLRNIEDRLFNKA